jgi:hypothetical protein|tara:strand:- start:64 stop:519 length:456 start_codon:yes stop_codon:yes gene_type:complete
MKFKISIQPKIAYYLSIVLTLILFFYFSYKGVIAYFIHKELYGGGIDILVTLRATLAGVMLFLSLLLLQFSKIKDLKSHRTILNGIFIGWSTIIILLIILNPNLIYFIIMSGLGSFFSLITLLSLADQIKEEKNSLTDKEIYLLQKLANKK